MEKKKIEILLITSAIVSLIILYFSSDFEYKEIKKTKECEGKIKLTIKINKTFYSKKNKYFGKTNDFLIFLDNYRYIETGDKILVFGKGTKKNKTCFIFPDKIIILDVKS